jgi:hypothetical protein
MFKKLSKTKFKLLAFAISALGDLMFIIFIRSVVFQRENLQIFLNQYTPSGLKEQMSNLSFVDQEQMLKMMTINLDILIVLWLVMSAISYILFFKERKFGINYIKNGTALFGIMFSAVTVYEALPFSKAWALAFLLLTPLYIFVYLGMRHFFPKKIETTKTSE